MVLAKQWLKTMCMLTSLAPLHGLLAADETSENINWQNTAATVSIIIDDIGYSRRYGEAIVDLDERLTLSILPFTPFSQHFSDLGRASGNEIMLHLPMESMSNQLASDTQLEVSMGKGQFSKMLARNLAAFEGYTGINNHQGSRMMKDARRLEWLMGDIADESMFFVDSRTVGHSPANHIATRYGIPTVGRDIFLDDSSDEAEIKREFDRMITLALRNGHAVAIGHPRPATIRVLQRELPRLKALGIQVVPVTTTIALLNGQTMMAELDVKESGKPVRAKAERPAIKYPFGSKWSFDKLTQSSYSSFAAHESP